MSRWFEKLLKISADFLRFSRDLLVLTIWGGISLFLPKSHPRRVSSCGPFCEKSHSSSTSAEEVTNQRCPHVSEYHNPAWFHVICPSLNIMTISCEHKGLFRVRRAYWLGATVLACAIWGALIAATWGGYRVVRFLASAQIEQTAPKAAPSVASRSSVPESSDSLQLARLRMKEGKIRDARIEAKNAVQKEPMRSEAYLVLGEASLQCGMRKDAQEAFEKAVSLGCADGSAQIALARLARSPSEMLRWAKASVAASNSIEALTVLSTVQEIGGDLQAARATARQAWARNPHDTNAVVHLADMEIKSGNLIEAERLYKGLLASDPMNLASLVGVARIRFARKDMEGSVADLQRVLKVDPTHVAALELLSDVYLSKRDFTALEDLYKHFTAQQPQLFTLRAQWSVVLLSFGRVNDAYNETSRLIHDNPGDVNAHLVMGELFLRLGMWTMAEQYARRAIELDPLVGKGHELFARILMSQGRNDRAVDELAATRRIDSDNLDAILLMAPCLHFLGREREAASLLEQAGKDHPRSPAPFAYLGEIQMQAANYAAAAESFKKALLRDGTNAVVMNNLVMALVRSEGASDAALEMAMRARAQLPGNPLVADTLGWIYLQRKEYRKASDLLESAVLMAPQHPTICLHLGMLLCSTGHSERGAQYLNAVIALSQDAEELEQAKALLTTRRESGDVQQDHG